MAHAGHIIELFLLPATLLEFHAPAMTFVYRLHGKLARLGMRDTRLVRLALLCLALDTMGDITDHAGQTL